MTDDGNEWLHLETGRYMSDAEVYRELDQRTAPPAGVVCWAARDGDRTAWLFQSEPEWHEDSGAWVNAEADMTVAVPLRDETAESLGLVPGECARVRITKLDEEPTRT